MLDKTLLNGLYVLTDATLTPEETILEQIERVLKSGVRVIQYRDKYADDNTAEATCRRLQALCDVYEALFIIDDRVELAHRIQADGIHIGADDASYEEARALLGKEKVIGVSCYGDIERALRYEALGADYVAFGAFFPSPTKPNAPIVAPALLQEAKARLHTPICTIGGITHETIQELVSYRVAMHAVISAIYRDDKIEENIERFHALLKH